MDYKKYIQMIDEYIQEPNNINREWVECLTVCRSCLERMLPKKQSKTNYECIKQMSIEEMAEFICSIYDDNQEPYTADKNIEGYTIPDYDESNIKEWLEQEVEE